jgi:17beta-estradiol 17-dehydrogenase / very-long-chain 3-oxoacyl-CoA reductase
MTHYPPARLSTEIGWLTRVFPYVSPRHPAGTESRIHAIDFGSASPEDYASLSSAARQLPGPVGVLVNNVGVSHSYPTWFHEIPEREIDSVVDINIIATMRVTRMVLPSMLEGCACILCFSIADARADRLLPRSHDHSKKGLILNMGSFAALTSSPLLAPYAGSKNFLYAWSQALGAEYESKGISVQLLNTFFVVSQLSKIRRSNWMTPMPKQYVRESALSPRFTQEACSRGEMQVAWR